MVFNSFQFILVYPFLFLIYYAIPARWGRARNIFLLILSYILYIRWNPAYSLILLLVTAITYFSAIWMERIRNRKLIVTFGGLFALLPLLVFKYYNFINDNISALLALLGFNCQLPGLNWTVPLGISFFTFQALGYLFDVYYKRGETEQDFIIYALFVSFFPSILSGPINKASLVIPQLKSLRPYFD